VTIWDDYIREIEQDLAERRRSLEPLKSGQMRLGERRIGTDPWVDTTKREISRREKTIAVYEALLVRLRAEREASQIRDFVRPAPTFKGAGRLTNLVILFFWSIGASRRERDQSLSHRRLLLVPLMMETDLATIFSSRRGGFLPVDPLHLLGEYEPTGRYLFECALYGQVPCLRRALFGVVRSLSVHVRP